ncbi:hypothetical protein HanRHA438_Chr02g0067771 [Helianthus annuus]|nr:hypothetical protein HanLR1_Chr02g0055651 [Helianthus annuus]KAJ0940007.1 hypothetical protein HanRHA438_Chr02g0067771 [Helianthus annuus]
MGCDYTLNIVNIFHSKCHEYIETFEIHTADLLVVSLTLLALYYCKSHIEVVFVGYLLIVVVELVVSNVRNGGCGKDILNLLMPWLVLKDANCGINVDLLCAIIASQLFSGIGSILLTKSSPSLHILGFILYLTFSRLWLLTFLGAFVLELGFCSYICFVGCKRQSYDFLQHVLSTVCCFSLRECK